MTKESVLDLMKQKTDPDKEESNLPREQELKDTTHVNEFRRLSQKEVMNVR